MKLPYIVTSVNTAQTERIGAEFAKWILAHKRDGEGCFVALYGDLGAGKTAFIRGAVSVAAPQAHTQSPTYTVVNEYASGRVPVYHMDVYRLQTICTPSVFLIIWNKMPFVFVSGAKRFVHIFLLIIFRLQFKKHCLRKKEI